MKKLIIETSCLFALMLITSNSFGQIEKGKWLAGIGFSYGTNKFTSSQTNRDQRTSSSDISLSMGRFLTKKFALGVGYSYSNDKSNSIYSQDNYYKSNANTNGINLTVSNFANLEKNLYYSPNIIISYNKNISKFWTKQPGFQEVINRNKSAIMSAAIYPIQFSYLLKNKLLMQAGFGEIKYAYINSKSDIPTNNDAVGESHGFNISFFPNISNIGISIIF